MDDPAEIEVQPKGEAWRPTVRCDPADLLRVALPWISDEGRR